jgi:hypothetical protein
MPWLPRATLICTSAWFYLEAATPDADRLIEKAIQFLALIDALPGLTVRGFDASGLDTTGLVVKKFSNQNLTLADAHGECPHRTASLPVFRAISPSCHEP